MHFSRSRYDLRHAFHVWKRSSRKKPVFSSEKSRFFAKKSRFPHALAPFAFSAASHLAPFKVVLRQLWQKLDLFRKNDITQKRWQIWTWCFGGIKIGYLSLPFWAKINQKHHVYCLIRFIENERLSLVSPPYLCSLHSKSFQLLKLSLLGYSPCS